MIGTHRYTVSLDTKDLARMATDDRLALDVEHDEVVEIGVNGSQYQEVLDRAEFVKGSLVKWDGEETLPR